MMALVFFGGVLLGGLFGFCLSALLGMAGRGGEEEARAAAEIHLEDLRHQESLRQVTPERLEEIRRAIEKHFVWRRIP